MRRYTYAGLTLGSEVELHGLPPASPNAAPDLSVSHAELSCTALSDADLAWIVDPTNSWWSEAENDRGWWLQVSGQAVVCVTDEGRRVLIDVAPGADPEFVAHLVVDFVLPVCLDLLGRLVVHATAVALDGAVVAFTPRAAPASPPWRSRSP